MKTKKLITILLILLITGISAASAQVRFGIKGGVDIADHTINTSILNAKNRMGFQVGPLVEFSIPVIGLGVDAGLQYGYKNYNVEEKARDADISNYSYLSIPVNLKKRFGIIPGVVGIFVSAGPYANVRLSGGELRIRNLDDTYDRFKAKNFEVGFNVGAGVHLVDKLDLGIYYRNKLTDNYSADKAEIGDLKDKNYQTWSIAATYFF